MAHQVAVVGMGRFGASLASELYKIGHDVLVIDRSEVRAQEMMGHATYSVTGDSTSPDLLEEVGIRNFDTAVVAIGSDIQSSVLTTVLLKQFNLREVVARATTELHGQTLRAVGADRVVYPEQETGIRTAHSLFQREVLEYMELNGSYGLSKLRVPDDMVGKQLIAAGFNDPKDRRCPRIVAISRGRENILAPSDNETLNAGDQIIVAGPEDALERLGLQA